jgi:ribosomal protein L37AE/L43A
MLVDRKGHQCPECKCGHLGEWSAADWLVQCHNCKRLFERNVKRPTPLREPVQSRQVVTRAGTTIVNLSSHPLSFTISPHADSIEVRIYDAE